MDTAATQQEFFGKQYAHLGQEEIQLRVGSYVLYIAKNKSVTGEKVSQILNRGFSENEKCILLGGEALLKEVGDSLAKKGRQIEGLIRHGQLMSIKDRGEFYQKNTFSMESFFSQLQTHIDDTCLQGWASLRVVTDIQWLFEESKNKSKGVIQKELELFNEFTSKRNFLFFIGFLTSTQLTSRNLMDIINTHPLLLFDDNFMTSGPSQTLNIDNLTGLFNQIHFTELLKKEVARSARYNRKFSIVIFDIDDFKHINRQFGYARGDDLLMQISGLLLNNIRNVDILGRSGGGEFSVLLPETDKMGGILMGQRMLKLASDKIEIDDYPVTLSAGVSGYPDDSKNHLELLTKASEALKNSQSKGKNKVYTLEDALPLS
jgi:diguanylate cyclase (GGDEF)-like protein